MPNESPLLTIAIPTYNCAHFLPDALNSIRRQELDDFEILILDNASEDNTEEVIQSFRDERIRYIRNSSNVGSQENGNRCILNSRGKYLRFLCADDVLLDGILKKQLAILEAQPAIALVTCDNFITNECLKISGYFPAFPGTQVGSRVINACVSGFANYIGGPSNVMLRREQVSRLKTDAKYKALADLKLYLQVLEMGDYANIGEPGYLYRLHASSDTQVNTTTDLSRQEHIKLVSEFNGWNLISCFRAIRTAGSHGWRALSEHGWEALSIRKLAMATRTFRDVIEMRRRWRVPLPERTSQVSTEYCLER